MPLLSDDHTRLTRTYDGKFTVIEGSEFWNLEERWREHISRGISELQASREKQTLSPEDLHEIHVDAILNSWIDVYGENSIDMDDLRLLSTSDARKLQLWWEGKSASLYSVLAGQHKDDVLKYFEGKPSLLESINQIIVLRPAFFGIGIDINAFIKRIIDKRKNG